MTTTRKQYSPKFKARVAVEAIRGEKTLSQLGSQFQVHPIQIAKWRKSALEQLPELFVDGRTRKARNGETESIGMRAVSRGTARLWGNAGLSVQPMNTSRRFVSSNRKAHQPSALTRSHPPQRG